MTPSTNLESENRKGPDVDIARSGSPFNINPIQLRSPLFMQRILEDREQMEEYCRNIRESGLYGSKFSTWQDVMLVIQFGYEKGLAPTEAIQEITVFSNKLAIYGDVAFAKVLASGLLTDYKEQWDEKTLTCTISGQRKDIGAEISRSFSKADAIRAGLWISDDDVKANAFLKDSWWYRFPKNQIFYRARGFFIRHGFSDVTYNLHTVEELRSDQDLQKKVKGENGGEVTIDKVKDKTEKAGRVVGEVFKKADRNKQKQDRLHEREPSADEIVEKCDQMPEEYALGMLEKYSSSIQSQKFSTSELRLAATLIMFLKHGYSDEISSACETMGLDPKQYSRDRERVDAIFKGIETAEQPEEIKPESPLTDDQLQEWTHGLSDQECRKIITALNPKIDTSNFTNHQLRVGARLFRGLEGLRRPDIIEGEYGALFDKPIPESYSPTDAVFAILNEFQSTEPDDSASDEKEVNEESPLQDSYTEKELKNMSLEDLWEIIDSKQVEVPDDGKKNTNKKLRLAILDHQDHTDENRGDEKAEDETPEPDAKDTPMEESSTEDGDEKESEGGENPSELLESLVIPEMGPGGQREFPDVMVFYDEVESFGLNDDNASDIIKYLELKDDQGDLYPDLEQIVIRGTAEQITLMIRAHLGSN